MTNAHWATIRSAKPKSDLTLAREANLLANSYEDGQLISVADLSNIAGKGYLRSKNGEKDSYQLRMVYDADAPEIVRDGKPLLETRITHVFATEAFLEKRKG